MPEFISKLNFIILINNTHSATLNARLKFPRRFFGFNILKSNASGQKLCIRAQNAIPSAKLDEKFSIETFCFIIKTLNYKEFKNLFSYCIELTEYPFVLI